MTPERVQELLEEYGGYDHGLKLYHVGGTCLLGEFIEALESFVVNDQLTDILYNNKAHTQNLRMALLRISMGSEYFPGDPHPDAMDIAKEALA